jgi:hypothetical protein
MRRLTPLVAATAAATSAALFGAAPVTAQPIEKGHFTDNFVGEPYSCDGLVMAQDSGAARVNFLFNKRGPNLAYYREHVHGTGVTTNLETGGTYTNVFSGNSRDHTIVDNGDGTLTITVHFQGSSRWYDQFGNFVLSDDGPIWSSFVVDHGGTPGDPSDDVEVPDSFELLRVGGKHDTEGRDFCTDLVLFTS